MKMQFQGIRIISALASDDIRISKKNQHVAIMNTQLTQQGRRHNQMYKRRFRKSQKRQTEIEEIKAETKAGCTIPLIPQVVSAPHSTERRKQVNFQINQNQILLSLPVIQEEIHKTTQHKHKV
ncbi:Hypothetical_protein [Hexamita inflata]|uniref:Hypothetical_protein n=1 Tax=Hexamita inflata TaxID=28002 RepID=A0AA86RF80_9EUKA|nr:Hypothetical protein HINF_LOCUS58809 [Hexamita inflata]